MRCSVIFSTVIITAACGGSPLTADEAIDQGLQQGCEKAFECRDSFPTIPGFSFELIYGTSVDDCVQRLGAEVNVTAVRAAIQAGRITFRADDAQTCLDAQAGLTCAEVWDSSTVQPAACDTAFDGTVALGASCTIDDECADDGAYCDETDHVCAI